MLLETPRAGSPGPAALPSLKLESRNVVWKAPGLRAHEAAAGSMRLASAERGYASQGHLRVADRIWSHGEHLMHRELAVGEVLS